ncbi:butyrophilin-like protein 1 [Centropristis striata]|uniref:butyrophilin-like protein 1 n=1 Tax=Centropristis striata TaxID=184440 RepID=UPI0027DEEB32|nr:butyrophilin-like protein 1 [Centropristis striata]
MNQSLFLLAALLSSCSGESVQTVLAFAGGDVILPCSVIIPDGADFPTVEWSKEKLQPHDVVLLYRDGCEIPEMKNPAFRYRTSLLTRELNNGNVSLRISSVQLADAGTYRCMRLWRNRVRDVSTVELRVAALSDPELSVTAAEGGGVAALCEALCWLPVPQIDFLDERGNVVPAEQPKRDQDARGCFTVRRRAALLHVPHRITCRVQQTETNQTREAKIHIPVGRRKSCLLFVALTAGGTFLLLAVPLGVLVFLVVKRRGKSAEGQQLSVSRSSSESGSPTEDRVLMRRVGPSGSEVVIEMLKVKVDDLQTKLQEKDQIIQQLQSNNTNRALTGPAGGAEDCRPAAPPSAPEPADVPLDQKPRRCFLRQNSNPSPGRPTPPLHRNHSSPALLNLPLTAGEKKPGRLSRSMSDAHRRPGPTARTRRRHSSAFPFTAPVTNLATRLDALSEESEMLISNDVFDSPKL